MSNQLAIAALSDTSARKSRPVRRAPAAKPAIAVTADPREIQVAIVPSQFERRIDRIGRPYAWIRGTLVHRKVEQVRTVMAQGQAYHDIQHLLGVGASIVITGTRETIVDKATGAPGGEIFRAACVVKVLGADGREIDAVTGLPLRSLVGHERKGYYRTQRHGPNNSLVKTIWVDEVKVNGGRLAA